MERKAFRETKRQADALAWVLLALALLLPASGLYSHHPRTQPLGKAALAHFLKQ